MYFLQGLQSRASFSRVSSSKSSSEAYEIAQKCRVMGYARVAQDTGAVKDTSLV